jgi:hypothetical protein
MMIIVTVYLSLPCMRHLLYYRAVAGYIKRRSAHNQRPGANISLIPNAIMMLTRTRTRWQVSQSPENLNL